MSHIFQNFQNAELKFYSRSSCEHCFLIKRPSTSLQRFVVSRIGALIWVTFIKKSDLQAEKDKKEIVPPISS